MIRFLELLKLELGADDAYAQVGGRDPSDPARLWTDLRDGWRVVLCFEQPLVDRDAKQARLEQLVAGFSQTIRDDLAPALPVMHPDSTPRRLDVALEALRARTGGVSAVVVDIQSPVLWGSAGFDCHADDVEVLVKVGQAIDASLKAGLDLAVPLAGSHADLSKRLHGLGVDADHAARLAMADGDDTSCRHHLMTCVAIARARSAAGRHKDIARAHHDGELGYFVRGFANIYLLIVVFAGDFSELHVESTVLHALPTIEQLLLSLPPLDPKPKGASVLKFKR